MPSRKSLNRQAVHDLRSAGWTRFRVAALLNISEDWVRRLEREIQADAALARQEAESYRHARQAVGLDP